MIAGSEFSDFRGEDGRLRLRGGRCRSCGAVAFPLPAGCARCTSEDLEEIELPDNGVLWSWTIQRFRPKPPYRGPDEFEPFGVGYVDLGSVIVEGRLTVADPDDLEIGMRMTLVDNGAGYAFAPIGGAS